MPYNRINWKNGEAGNTPLNQTNLNHMEDGIKANERDIAKNKSAIDSAELAIDALQLRPTFAIVNTSKSPLKESGSSNILAIDALANTMQDTSPNLFNPNMGTNTQYAVTCTRNADKTYTVNGTNTTTAGVWPLGTVKLEAGKTYKIVGCPSGGGASRYYLQLRTPQNATFKDDTGSGIVFTAPESGEYIVRIYFGVTTFNNVLFKPMVTENTALTYSDYVPYNQPAPDNVVPIVDASGEIKARCKNLCNLDEFAYGKSWATQAVAERGYVDVYPEQGKTYTASINNISGMAAAVFFMKNNTEATSSNNLAYDSASGKIKHTFTINNNEVKFVRFLLVSQAGAITKAMVDNAKPIIEEGSSAGEYEAYKGNVINIEGNLFSPANISHAQFSAGKIIVSAASRLVFAEAKPNEIYTISKKRGAFFRVGYTTTLPNVGESVYSVKDDYTAESITYITGSDARYIVALVWYSSLDTTISADDMLATVQIERGPYATPYKNYNDSLHITLRSSKEIRDQLIIYEGGTGKHIQRVKAVELSALNWTKINISGVDFKGYYADLTDTIDANDLGAPILAERYEQFRYNGTAVLGKMALSQKGMSGVNGRLVVYDYDNVTPSGMFYYPLKTPIETELTRDQIRQILALRTYSPETYIDTELDVTITYVGDPRAYIDNKDTFPVIKTAKLEPIDNELLIDKKAKVVITADGEDINYNLNQYLSDTYRVITSIQQSGVETNNRIKEITAYSEDEKNVGSWINPNLKLRRVVALVDTPNVANLDAVVFDDVNLLLHEVKSISGTFTQGNDTYPINFYKDGSNYCRTWASREGIIMNVQGFTACPCEIVIEYIRKADAPTAMSEDNIEE